MSGAREHDTLRFAQAWAEALPAVAGYLTALLPDRHAVDDLVQEVALTALRAFPAYDQGRPFAAWALGIARHKLHDRWRALARGRHLVADPALLDDIAALAEELEDDLAEERQALQRCLRGLGERAWAVVRGHYHDDLDPEALAGRLGTTAGNVRVMLHRIRESLRACIRRHLAGGGAHG